MHLATFFAHLREKSGRLHHHYIVFAALMALMLGGGFQVISSLSRTSLWIVWGITWFLIYKLGHKLPMSRLLRPVMPLLIWIFVYYIWGTIVSPIPVMAEGIKMAFYLVTIASGLAIVTSNPARLTVFANFAQWAVVGNLVVTLLLINIPEFQALFIKADLVHAEGQLSSDRFSGLWGNANAAGFVSLLALTLSAWSNQKIAWLGRFCGIVLIYLTVSRTANWLLFAILTFYLFIVVNERTRILILAFFIFGAIIGSMILVLDKNIFDLIAQIMDNPEIARLLDLSESETRAKGYESRFDVLVRWLPVIESGPWYGYGLNAMAGGGSQGIIFRTDIPYMGVHNLYIGILLDAGLIGVLSFLLVLGYQLFKLARIRFQFLAKWGVFSLYFVVLIFSLFNHNMLSSMDGMIAYVLLFILPTCPALARLRIPRRILSGVGLTTSIS